MLLTSQTSQNRELVAHFLAFANPTRLRILQRMAQTAEISVNELAEHLRMSQPRISWHLRTLRVGGVIRTRREGRLVFCSLDLETISERQLELRRLLGMGEAPIRGGTQIDLNTKVSNQ